MTILTPGSLIAFTVLGPLQDLLIQANSRLTWFVLKLCLSFSGLSLFQNGESRRVRDDRFLPEGNAAKGKQYWRWDPVKYTHKPEIILSLK